MKKPIIKLKISFSILTPRKDLLQHSLFETGLKWNILIAITDREEESQLELQIIE